MENRIAVSVVIPAYNGAELIGRCLESVCAQSFKDYEVVVVDDCSSDGTADVVGHYAASHPNVRLIRKEVNQGTMEARRSGYESARGEYVVFCDCDDTLPEDALATMYATIVSRQLDMVLYGLRIIATDGSVKFMPRLRTQLQSPAEVYPALMRQKITWYLCAGIYRRELFLGAGIETFGRQSVNEDFMLLLQLFQKTDRYGFENEYVYDYRLQPQSSSQGAPSPEKLRQELWANKWCCEYLCSRSICVGEARRLYLRRIIKCLPRGFSRAQILSTGLVDQQLFTISNIRRYAGLKYVLKYWLWSAIRALGL